MKSKLLVLIVLFAASALGASATTRQQQVRSNGEHVMPFSLNATLHEFRPVPLGGVMTIVARKNDAAQIRLIQSHLLKEANAFERGNYADPAAIHGMQMPGLPYLSTHSSEVVVRYQPLEKGARISFFGSTAKSVKAIHEWFAAQLADHGSDATMHM